MENATHFVSLVLDQDYAENYFNTVHRTSYDKKTLATYQNNIKRKNMEYQLLKRVLHSKYDMFLMKKYYQMLDSNAALEIFESDLLYQLLNGKLEDYRILGYSKKEILNLIHKKMNEVRAYDSKYTYEEKVHPITRTLTVRNWKK